MSASFLEKLVFDAYRIIPASNRTPLFTARITISLLFTINALSLFIVYEEIIFSLHGFKSSGYLIPSKFEFILYIVGAIIFTIVLFSTKSLNDEDLLNQQTIVEPNYFLIHRIFSLLLLIIPFYFL
ncbi:hypothetical protein [Hymenobacter psoromatis]|uniref:hypothetical protein n=1 Tax=Hymenobacter psoromatis TaxID=1484116 RepID=UPI001CBEFC3D|nr:hypothetical protein [Hymenobacter psoromatis]